MEGTIFAANFVDQDKKTFLDEFEEFVKSENPLLVTTGDKSRTGASAAACDVKNEELDIVEEELPSPSSSEEETCDSIFVMVGLESPASDSALHHPREESKEIEVLEHYSKENSPSRLITEVDLSSDSEESRQDHKDFLTDEGSLVPEKKSETILKCLACRRHPEGTRCPVTQIPEFIVPNYILPQCVCCKQTTSFDDDSNVFGCIICLRKFKNPTNLNLHLRIHTGTNKYKCHHCHMTFDWDVHLKRHLRKNHTKLKSVSCSECGKSFSSNKELGKHKDTVHDKKAKLKVKCQLCPKTFGCPSSLRRHMKGHKRGLGCHVCGLTFTRDHALTHHMAKAHAEPSEDLLGKESPIAR